jgi:hypothetical protein
MEEFQQLEDFREELFRGNDRTLTVTAKDPEDGSDFSLTGATVWFTAKRHVTDPDEEAVFSKKTGGGGIVVLAEPDNNQARVSINRVDTADLPFRKVELECDVQTLIEGKAHTVARGILVVKPPVTRSLS